MASTASYKLTTGQLLEVTTTGVKRMSGENIKRVQLTLAGAVVRFKTIKSLMKPEDANDLEEYICDIADGNYESVLTLFN